MIQRFKVAPSFPALPPFAKLMAKLGESFIVRDVMVNLGEMEYVQPGDESGAHRLVNSKRYSAVPVSQDGKNFGAVYWTEHELTGERIVTELRQTFVSDHIPDSTPLAEAFFLFEDREWYLTLRENRVSGLVTYWAFNSREFRVQLYASLSRIEELSRDVLARDGIGISDGQGLNLSVEVLEKIRKRFESTSKDLGGNRFVDELEFHQVNDALRKHLPWRQFLHERLDKEISNTDYESRYNFTKFRDAVMHGRIVFPTYQTFKSRTVSIGRVVELIDLLEEYLNAND
jgi:hypothetical protein